MLENKELLTIGQVAKRLGILPSQVRYYSNLGLIKENSRSRGKYRLYNKKVLQDLKEIFSLKKEGYSLAQIKEMISKKPDLKKIFSLYPVKFAYLFGSQARGETGPLSDIDLAVFLDPNLDKDKRFKIRVELISRLLQMYKKEAGEVDLIVLNDTFNLLAYNIIFDGEVVYNVDETMRIRFESKVMSFYFDREYYYKRHARSTINRIAKEGIL